MVDHLAIASTCARRAGAHLLLEGDPGLARADESPPFNEGRAGLRAAHVDVEHCAANADRSRRRVDRVRLLVQAACREAKDPLGEIDGDLLGVGVPFVDEAIENNPGGWADSEVGRIEKDEFGERIWPRLDRIVAKNRSPRR
jgi:hypothetical protein